MVGRAQAFRHFVQTQCPLSQWAARQRDSARAQPQVSAAVVFLAVVFQAVFGLRSLLRLDQWLRWPLAKALVGSRRAQAASDTTLLRVVSAWQMRPLREAAAAWHRWLQQQGWARTRLSSGRQVALVIVDGTCCGGWWGCLLGFCGAVYHVVDVQRSRGRGHELAASRRLVGRVVKRLGPGFATHLLYDGLMAVREDFRRAIEEWGLHLVVKTREQSLEIVESSRAVWSVMSAEALRRAGVEVVRGVDAGRAVEYVIYAQSGIRWEGLKYPLVLAWVRETYLKGPRAGPSEEFWVISTDQSLRAGELRELAHGRWAIENNGFKELNARAGSKYAYLKDLKAKTALVLMWELGAALLTAFGLWLEQQRVEGQKRWRMTKQGLADSIVLTWGEVSGCGGSP